MSICNLRTTSNTQYTKIGCVNYDKCVYYIGASFNQNCCVLQLAAMLKFYATKLYKYYGGISTYIYKYIEHVILWQYVSMHIELCTNKGVCISKMQ